MSNPTYRIRGIQPPDLPSEPAIRLMFWQWVVELGLKQKDRELAKGLDKDGRPLRAISARTRKHRRSAMTPDGRGDPNAPALMPARALSRTRSLLAGRATADAAIFYWRFDPFTGDSWGKVLAIHRRKGRDVIGLSPKGIARVQALAWERWRAWKRGEPIATTTGSASPGIPQVGSYSTAHATFGIGANAPPAFLPGQSTGGMTWPEWQRYLRQPNPTTVAIPGRPEGHYNRVLAHAWGQQPPAPPRPAPRKPKPKPGPKPAPAPAPPPADPLRPYREWTPAARIGEARAWLEERLGVGRVTTELPDRAWESPEFPDGDAVLAHLNAIIGEWNGLVVRYPRLPRDPTAVLVARDGERGRASIPAKGAGGSGLLVKGHEWTPEQRRGIDEWERRAGRRWGSERPGTQVADNFRHELAHNLTTADLHARFVAAAKDAWGDGYLARAGAEISEYAGTNDFEAIAESFGIYTRADYNPGDLPAWAEAFWRSFLGA